MALELQKITEEINAMAVDDHYPFPGFTNMREYLAIDMAINELRPVKKFKYHIDFDYENAWVERIL